MLAYLGNIHVKVVPPAHIVKLMSLPSKWVAKFHYSAFLLQVHQVSCTYIMFAEAFD